jgi:hypothetical protein
VSQIRAERDVLGLIAGEIAERALVEAGELLQFQGIHLAPARLHEREGRPRDSQEGRDLILREPEVLPRFTEPFAQRLPILILDCGPLLLVLTHGRTFELLRSVQSLPILPTICPKIKQNVEVLCVFQTDALCSCPNSFWGKDLVHESEAGRCADALVHEPPLIRAVRLRAGDSPDCSLARVSYLARCVSLSA